MAKNPDRPIFMFMLQRSLFPSFLAPIMCENLTDGVIRR